MGMQGLEAAISTIETDSIDQANEVGRMLLEAAQDYTPVRTGRLRAGWELDEATHFGDDVILRNDVEYAMWVNDGTSKMAPRMMLERAIATVTRQVATPIDRRS